MVPCIIIIIIINIIIYLSCSWATCWPVPVSRVQKPLQRSAMIPSASHTAVFHYPGQSITWHSVFSVHHKIIYIYQSLCRLSVVILFKTCFGCFLPIIRRSYTVWSAVGYGKRKCCRELWCPVLSVVWSVLPWHNVLINLFIYFCLTCFGLSFSPSSEAGVQFRHWSSLLGMVSAPRRWHHTQQDWTTAEVVQYTCLWRWAKRRPKHVSQK
jgi:hypothetical protein